jgi:hypothetical protein
MKTGIDPRFQRFREAYLQMAREANYRPGAPSDGFGHTMLDLEQLRDPERLQAEATDYAISFLKEEDGDCFWVGCSDFRTNRAFFWAIETARLLASGDGGNVAAIKLLRMAAREVARVEAQIKKERSNRS